LKKRDSLKVSNKGALVVQGCFNVCENRSERNGFTASESQLPNADGNLIDCFNNQKPHSDVFNLFEYIGLNAQMVSEN